MNKACPVCESPRKIKIHDLRDHYGRESFELTKCADCGAVFLGTAPASDAMEAYYDNAAGVVMRTAPSKLFRRMQAYSFAREMKPLFRQMRTVESVLDLGAGDGALIDWCRPRGRVAAIDFFPASQWHFSDIPYRSADLHGGKFSSADLVAPLGRAPQAVVMRHVLEHLHEPRLVIKTLADSGVDWLYIVVPNVEAWGASVFGPNWYYWDPPRHLTFFSKRSLQSLLERAGYVVAEAGTYGLDETVTSAHRWHLARFQSPQHWFARMTRPKGLLAGFSSAAASFISNTVCWCVARRR